MKKILLKFINRYSLIYLPLGWIFGLVIFFVAFEPSSVLYILSFFVIGSFFGLYLFNSKRGLVVDNHNFSNFEYTIIEFYSDYWLGCTASKFIVNEFKRKHEDIPIVSVNASKKDYLETIEKYNLKYTPTYVLVDKYGEKIYKRVGTFNVEKFDSIVS